MTGDLATGRDHLPKGERPKEFDHKMLMLYASRYYPHKNHRFILSLAGHLKERGIQDVVFMVTLDPDLAGVKPLIEEIEQRGLSDLIVNLGELPAAQLLNWYQWADGLFFPSYLETFGNPLLEAMGFGLPICAVDLPYSRILCEDCAVYYRVDSAEDAMNKILHLKKNPGLCLEMGRKGREKFLTFPGWNEVAQRYLSLLESRIRQ